jgi:glycine/serine hydroxymethyltransferase
VKPSSGQAANYKTYLSMLQQERTLLLQEEATVKSGDQATYGSLDSRRTSLTNSSDRLAQRMGLSVCANRGITNADKAQITQLAASAKTNSPSQCTQDMTPAFVKQEFGSMAACITNGKQPVGPSNAKSVDISNIAGAGDFATGDVVLHLRSGHTQNLSAAFFRQHGSWRLLGLQNR